MSINFNMDRSINVLIDGQVDVSKFACNVMLFVSLFKELRLLFVCLLF